MAAAAPLHLTIAHKECFKAIFDDDLNVLRAVCTRNGMEIRLAGGPVRDLLLEQVPRDLDFATTIPPDEIVKIFAKEGIRVLDYGTKAADRGTVIVRINGSVNYEITTTHSDVDFHHQDWEKDANRRDLTINSMFLDLEGNLYDYFNGYEDLQKKRVLFVGDTDQRIRADYLRILRYFRFYGHIKANPEDHDQPTLEVIRRNASGLDGVAGERIWVELKKIIRGHFADHQIHRMIDLKVTKHIGLPDGCDSSGFSAIYERASRFNISESALLASLFTSISQVKEFHKRIKLSRVEYQTMLFIVNERSSYHFADSKFYQDEVLDSVEIKAHLYLAKCVQLAAYMGDSVVYNALSSWEIPTMPFSAKNLLEAGVPKGQLIFKYVSIIRQHWKQSNYKATNEELVNYTYKMIEEGKFIVK